mgnify:CR=1 FL=1
MGMNPFKCRGNLASGGLYPAHPSRHHLILIERTRPKGIPWHLLPKPLNARRSTNLSITSTITQTKHIPQIMDLVNKAVPDSVFPTQRAVIGSAIKEHSNWYELIMRAFRLNPAMRSRLLKTLIVDANLLAWPVQQKSREREQCNIPWAILLDPTSACNLHCTGCWAAEYGHKLNLTYEDICSIIDQGRELARISTSIRVASHGARG